MFQTDLRTLHRAESRRLIGDLSPQLGNHAVPAGELRLQDLAVVSRVAYRLFESIDFRTGSDRSCLSNFLAPALAHLKGIDSQGHSKHNRGGERHPHVTPIHWRVPASVSVCEPGLARLLDGFPFCLGLLQLPSHTRSRRLRKFVRNRRSFEVVRISQVGVKQRNTNGGGRLEFPHGLLTV